MVVRELITKLGFDIETSKFQRFDRDVGELRNNLGQVSRNLRAVADDIGRVGRKLTMFVSLPLAGIGIFSVKAAAQIEQVGLSFEVMLDSAEKGKKLLEDLFTFAKRTPFQIEDMGPVAKQMLAMGVEADDMIDTLTMLGNAAAGLGVPIQRLALNFGQVKSQTRLTGRELRDFTIAGVPLLEVLAEMVLGTKDATAGIRDMVERGEISFSQVEAAFQKMSGEGGRFNNLMERMAEKTLIGVWSNFLDGVFLARVELGKVIVKTLKLDEGLKKLNKKLDKTVTWFQGLQEHTKRFIVFAGIFLIVLGPMLMMISALAKSIFFLHSALLIVKASFFGAAGAAGTFNASMLLIPLLILAAIVAFGLFVEDVYTWVKGGDSLVGDLLGPWEDFAAGFKSIWNGLSNFLDELFLSMFTGNFEKVIEDLKNFKKEFQIFIQDIFGLSPTDIELEKLQRQRLIGGEFDPIKGIKEIVENLATFAGGLTGERSFTGRGLVPMAPAFPGTTKSIGDINIHTEINVAAGIEGGGTVPRDIADAVEDVFRRKLEETITANLTP